MGIKVKEKAAAYQRIAVSVGEIFAQADGDNANTPQILTAILADLSIYGSDEVLQQFLRIRQQPNVTEVVRLLAVMRAELHPETAISEKHLLTMFQ